MRMRRLAQRALVAGAFALGAAATAASAQVTITGKETNLANHSAYGGPAGDLPPAPAPGSSTQYSNSFECIPDSAAAPSEKIAIHGQYDLRSTRTTRTVRPPMPARISAK